MMILTDDSKSFVNDTYRLLFPILRLYGKEYVRHISTLYKQSVFIDDLECFRNKGKDYLYIVINVPLTKEKYGNNTLADTMNWFRQQSYVEKDYIMNVNSKSKSPVHIVMMIKLPQKYSKCVDKFLKGNTDMFTKEDIEKCFKDMKSVNNDFFSHCRNILVTKRKIKINLNNEVLNY